MKVTFISHSDLLGGAAIVTYRLMQAMRLKGIDARMLVYTKLSNSPWVSTVSTRWKRGLKFALERASLKLLSPIKRQDLFKVSPANTGMPIWNHPLVKDADIIALGWFNQGLLSINGLKKLATFGKPIVWTMHDMWAFTGICHHAYQCTNYQQQCGLCPFLGQKKHNDLSHKTWLRKQQAYTHANITFVAVSNWLANKARQSQLLKNANIKVIANAFPASEFHTTPMEGYPAFAPMMDRRRIIMGAARLDDPIKGLDIAIDALNHLFVNNPEVANNTGIVFFGELHDRSKLDRLLFPHLYMGRVNDPALLRQIYASADVVLSTSLYENLPGTLIEGQAAGCIPVTFNRGGQDDIVRQHGYDGFIAEYLNPQSVAQNILKALNSNIPRQRLHDLVVERFDAPVIADQYLNLFTTLLQSPTELAKPTMQQ